MFDVIHFLAVAERGSLRVQLEVIDAILPRVEGELRGGTIDLYVSRP